MRIYLVRHAEAVDRVPGMPDEARALTARGRLTFRELCGRFRGTGAAPSRILTSPFIRAVQTAEILSEAIRYDGEVVVAPQLSPGFDVEGLDALLEACRGAREVALIGHEPDLGILLTRLLSLPRGFTMRKGSIAALDLPDAGNRRRAGFVWLLSGDQWIDDPSLLVP
ncbi:MAG: histidine phosphatase family protein [Deltaproteobacteria bacterium]|nr:histidine phosphatase family protein [Deltaproteobacteria bacterium]